MRNPTLLILAAGAGSRFGGLKQLVPIGPRGETLLEYSVYDAIRAGFSRLILVVRPEDEGLFRDRFDRGMARRIPVRYVHQDLHDLPSGFSPPAGRTRPWGTGHAVLAAESEIEGPFAVLNADDFYGTRPFAELSSFFGGAPRADVLTLAVVAYEVARTLTDAGPVSRALCQLDEAGYLRQIVEIERVWKDDGRILGRNGSGQQIELREDELVSMNMWGLDRDVFPELHRRFESFLTESGSAVLTEFLLPDVVQSLLSEGRVAVKVLPGGRQWCGITFQEDRPRVSRILAELVARGKYPEELWS